MTTNVYVSKSEKHDGLIIPSPNNPELGAIMLRSEEDGVNESGFLQTVKKVGLFKGRVSELERIIEKKNLKEGDNFSEKFAPVKLVIQESTTPFYEGQEHKIYGDNAERAGEPVLHNGEYVYRQTIVVSATSELQDRVLSVDQAPATSRSESAQPNTSFDQQGNR